MNYGVPTSRKRFFLAARLDGLPIVWPMPTHGNPDSLAVKNGKLLPWRTAAEIIDWSIPCPSIFERVTPLVTATCRRLASGIVKFVTENPDPFIIGNQGIAPVMTEIANASSPRCMAANEPLRTVCAETKGGHHALIAAFISKHRRQSPGSEISEPLHTVAACGSHHGVVRCNLNRAANDHAYDVAAFIQAYYGSEKDGQDVRLPLRTIPTNDRFAVVTVRINNILYVIDDIGFRMLQPRELFLAQGFPPDYIITYCIDEAGNRIPFTKADQTRMCGNSVCPPLAEALIAANFTHEENWRAA